MRTLFVVVMMLQSCLLANASVSSDSLTVLVVYGCDANDHYPFPGKAWRDSLYLRVASFYKTMSYGQHRLRFKEAHNGEDYFRTSHTASYYKHKYDKRKYIGPFARFNEIVLNKALTAYGESYFSDVDLIFVAGSDGGPNWYIKGVNATGYGMLGCNFEAGEKVFKRGQGQGGLTFEIGSDLGTADAHDDRLISLADIHWTIAHEYGHAMKLMHQDKSFGLYSLMSRQRFPGENMPDFGPQPLDPFHIMQLGWLDNNDSSRVASLSKVDLPKEIKLYQFRRPEGRVTLRLDDMKRREQIYFTFHSTVNNIFDAVYPKSGLLIWQKRGLRVELLKKLDYPESAKGMMSDRFIYGDVEIKVTFIAMTAAEIHFHLTTKQTDRY